VIHRVPRRPREVVVQHPAQAVVPGETCIAQRLVEAVDRPRWVTLSDETQQWPSGPEDRDLLRPERQTVSGSPDEVDATSSRAVCGPVVDVVQSVARRFSGSGIRFIHVEVYRDNDPTKGYNRWMRQWGLTTEPWTFLVGRDGRIKSEFEGSVSADELTRAVRAHLTP